jgi:hypothetical protein
LTAALDSGITLSDNRLEVREGNDESPEVAEVASPAG